MAGENITIVTTDTFEAEVLKAEKPVMVDFWATWCGPCQGLAPIIEEIADEFKDSIKVCKIDVDENRELAMQFRIMSIPTVMFFKGGEAVKREVGAYPKEQYVEMINSL